MTGNSGSGKLDITRILKHWSAGDRDAAQRLAPLVYEDMYTIARSYFARQQPGHTLQPTAIVNETYLKLLNQTSIKVSDRKHFLALAAKIMRQLLVDHVRTKRREKRGANWDRISLSAVDDPKHDQNIDLLILDEALKELSSFDERKMALVELRFFAEMSLEEAADVLGISRATASREWRFTRAWLSRKVGDVEGS